MITISYTHQYASYFCLLNKECKIYPVQITGRHIAGRTRKEIETETGKPLISPKNAIDFSKLMDDVAKTTLESEDD